jgi:hypothetical protein
MVFFIACAPKPVMKAPRIYQEDLSLEDVTEHAGKDIDVLKAIADIRINRNNEPYDVVNASVLARRPGWIHMRMYKFGMLVRDIVIKDEAVYVLSGKDSPGLRQLARELYNAIIWWGDLEDGVMHSEGDEYIIRTDNKTIYVEKANLMPLKQYINVLDTSILLTYDSPVEHDGFWYPSLINLYAGDFMFSVTLRKIIKNPELGPFDFQTP